MKKICLLKGHLIDVIKGELKKNGSIQIQQGEIVKISEEANFPKGYEVIDASGKTIMPGLIDCHLHLSLNGEPNYEELFIKEPPELKAIKAVNYAENNLKAGFTTVRDMGAVGYVGLALKEAIEKEVIKGPRLLISGKVITATSGHANFLPPWGKLDHSMSRVADGIPEVQKAVREQVQAGADNIKFCATGGVMDPGSKPEFQEYTQEEMEVIVKEARKFGKLTGTHAQGAEGIKAALLAGVDTIEHGIFLDEETITLMVEKGTYLVPTLIAPHNILKYGEQAGVPEYAIEKSRKVKDIHAESFKSALEAGVNIAMGTDTGTPFSRHGDNAFELELMVEYGLSEMEAIRVATYKAAKALNLGHLTGSIQKGKSADLLLIEGNPLEDITVLQERDQIEMVIKEGEIMYTKSTHKV